MKKEEKNNGISLFSQADYLVEQDPIEEIFALNLGDFIAENLISEDLARKIGANVKDKKVGLINQLKELISLYSLNNTLCVLTFDDNQKQAIYTSIAQSVKQMLDVSDCHIYLENGDNLELIGTTSSAQTTYSIDNDTAQGSAFLNRETVFRDVISIPMHCNIKSIGVIVIVNDANSVINEDYIELVESIGVLFATSMELQRFIDEINGVIENDKASVSQLQHYRAELTALIGDLCDYQQSFVEKLAVAVDKKGHYKVSHSRNSAKLAKELCKQLKLNEKTTDLIYYAALLQNIGKISLPEELFAVNGQLSSSDLQIIRERSNLGVNLLMHINFLSEVVPYIKFQKERYDGTGSPEGLKGQSIPFGSRIIAVADVYCALTSDRPFRRAMEPEKALEILKSESGTKWDPIIIQALCELKI